MNRSSLRLSVVIPFYEQQQQLDLTLLALGLQTLAADQFEVIVVDDGSRRPPEIGDRPFRTTMLRQPDRGFRAAAARALGAKRAAAPTLAFLDADTVPACDYLQALLTTVESASQEAPVLAVGQRRHADLAGWQPHRMQAWLTGEAAAPTMLPAPSWLADAYGRTRNLRDADERSYRFVISAVMALPRALYRRAGGFDPDFVGYGGEDWDLANRCWLAGAQFRHVPAAVAWHDGPDFGGRDEPVERIDAKNLETMRLGHVLADPMARGRGLRWATPESITRVHGQHGYGPLIAMLDSLLTHLDTMIWLIDEPHLPTAVTDDRVRVGDPPAQVLRRTRSRIDLHAPVWLPGGPPRCGPERTLVVAADTGRTVAVVEPTRHTVLRSREEVTRTPEQVGLRLLPETLSLEEWWSTRDGS